MEVNSASITGFLRFWLLAKLRRWRPRTYRFGEEQRAIEAWLELIAEAAQRSGDLALEVAECARLIKGYGDTHKRGSANYRLIETRVVAPVLAGRIPLRQGIDAVASARAAALLDPDGDALRAVSPSSSSKAHCASRRSEPARRRLMDFTRSSG